MKSLIATAIAITSNQTSDNNGFSLELRQRTAVRPHTDAVLQPMLEDMASRIIRVW